MPPTASPPPPPGAPVLLFDGDCGLCQRLVDRLIRCDRAGRLRFAPLQNPAAQDFLRHHGRSAENFDSLIFVPDWSRRYTAPFLLRTAGAIAALRVAGGSARFAAALLALVPTPWRDAGYRFIARRRQRWFGPPPTDWLARPEHADRFVV